MLQAVELTLQELVLTLHMSQVNTTRIQQEIALTMSDFVFSLFWLAFSKPETRTKI